MKFAAPHRLTALAVAAVLTLTPAMAKDGFVEMTSKAKAVDVMDALEAAVTDAGAKVIARVDHAQNAASVDMQLPTTQLLIFGNPKLGTQAMLDDRRAGVLLPLRVLVYEDAEDGVTKIVYQDIEDMFDDMNIDEDADYVKSMEKALKKLTEKAAGDQ